MFTVPDAVHEIAQQTREDFDAGIIQAMQVIDAAVALGIPGSISAYSGGLSVGQKIETRYIDDDRTYHFSPEWLEQMLRGFPTNCCILASSVLLHRLCTQPKLASLPMRLMHGGFYTYNADMAIFECLPHSYVGIGRVALPGCGAIVDITPDQFDVAEHIPPVYVGEFRYPWRLPFVHKHPDIESQFCI